MPELDRSLDLDVRCQNCGCPGRGAALYVRESHSIETVFVMRVALPAGWTLRRDPVLVVCEKCGKI